MQSGNVTAGVESRDRRKVVVQSAAKGRAVRPPFGIPPAAPLFNMSYGQRVKSTRMLLYTIQSVRDKRLDSEMRLSSTQYQ